MSVKMLVRCIGESCEDCPDLDISVQHFEYSGGCMNNLSCVHAESCERIKETIYKEMEEKLHGLGNGTN